MSDELMDVLIDEARKNKMRSQEFADLLWVLRTDCARPGELRAAEAFNYVKGKLIFHWNATRGYIWKNAKKTQRDRVIFLTPEVQRYVEKLVAAKPKGLIFRTPRDAGWLPSSIGNKWRWLVKRPSVVAYCKEHDIDPDSLKPYNFRHSWACNYLRHYRRHLRGGMMMLGTSVKMLADPVLPHGHGEAARAVSAIHGIANGEQQSLLAANGRSQVERASNRRKLTAGWVHLSC